MTGFLDSDPTDAEMEHDIMAEVEPRTPSPDPEASSEPETAEVPVEAQNTVSPDVEPATDLALLMVGPGQASEVAGEPAAIPQADGAQTAPLEMEQSHPVDLLPGNTIDGEVVWVDWNNDVPRLIEKYRSSPDNTPGTALHNLLIELQSVIAAQ